MRCDEIQQVLSEQMDAPTSAGDTLDGHVRRCPDCRAFLAGAHEARRQLRLAPLGDDLPDILDEVLQRLPATSPAAARRQRWRGAASVAASIAIGALVGALLVSTAERAPVVADELGERILAAQSTVSQLAARVTIEEHGWHPEVPIRRYTGRLRYRAPEHLLIDLEDRTVYPDDRWTPNDVTRVVTPDREWSAALPGCPAVQLPDCQPDAPRTTGVRARAPFSGDGAGVLDLIVPVDSFRLGGGTDLGARSTPDGQLVGVAVDAAQVAPLLEGFVGVGSWREVHPADPVELWVEATTLTPRELVVRAGSGSIRDQWAAQRGLTDRPGEPLLQIVIQPLPDEGSWSTPAAPQALGSMGFVDGGVTLPLPEVPEGMMLYRAGTQPAAGSSVATMTWSDGRAWLRVRAVEDWSAKRLFGDLGPLVRRRTLGDGRVLYVGSAGRAVAIHTDEREWLLDGSLAEQDLIRVAASLPVTGVAIPGTWAEAASGTLSAAAQTVPGLLAPRDLEGFGPPAVQVHDDLVVLGYVGSGGRELLVTQRLGASVAPPVVDNVIGVEVRGQPGRFLPDSGELEWVEGDVIVSLQSHDLGLEDLLQIAAGMRATP